MYFIKTSLWLILLTTLLAADAWGIEADEVWIKHITVLGNKKTKSALILREIDLASGDTIMIHDLTSRIDQNENLLINTGLFNEVEINIEDWNENEQSIAISIKVVESWYIYPLPILSLADRNFNVWWVEHNHSLERLNYGVRFTYVNFTGNRDKLKLILQGGYKRKILLQYERPYINAAKTLGLSARVFIDHKREFAYETRFNKQQFYSDDNNLLFKSFKSILTFHYRPKVESYHDVLIKYEKTRIHESAADLNPRYFLSGNKQQFFEVTYSFARERRDSRFYPLNGNYLQAWAHKEGVGIFNDVDRFYTILAYAHYFPIRPKINFEVRLKGKHEWLNQGILYTGLDALGYGEDFLRGYEYYVVDGSDFAYARNSLRFNILNRNFDLKKKMPLESYRNLPVMLWFSVNTDIGIAGRSGFNEDNPFNDRWLMGGGIGLDIILYHKFVFQVEYSMNHLKEKGLFLHIRSDI